MTTLRAPLVDRENSSARVSLVMVVCFWYELQNKGIHPMTHGVTFDHVCKLAGLLWPDRPLSLADVDGRVLETLKEVLFRQVPKLGTCHVLDSLTKATYGGWLTGQIRQSGLDEWLTIRPVRAAEVFGRSP